jgi:hypothetical protein
MSDRSSIVASDGNNKVKVGQGFIESDWLFYISDYYNRLKIIIN